MSQQSAFTLETSEDGLAVVTIDVVGEVQNTLRAEFSEQINEIFSKIKSDKTIKAVILLSGKEDSFIAGADIKMLEGMETEKDAENVSKIGHATFQQMNQLGVPVVAAIHGACLGGGLELALACNARVCTDSAKTTMGLPEVQLGLLPGGGGTQRLPRLIGIANALDLMLTGRQLKPKQALKMGLVDEVAPKANLLKAAKALASKLNTGRFERKDNGLSIAGIQKWALEKNQWGRQVLFDQARKKLKAKTHGNYPAPEYIIDCVEAGVEAGFDKGLAKEAELFGKLVKSPQAEQLMGIFFATTEMKKDSGVDTELKGGVRSINSIGVLGGGLMGAGIAFVSIEKAAVKVRIKDRDVAGVLQGLKYSDSIYQKRVKKRYLAPSVKSKKMAQLTGTIDYSGFSKLDMVVEAVFEDLNLKQQMVKDVEAVGKEDVIFATNTSSIPISEIAKASKHPETVIGLHYFSPVEKMPLLEIIKTEQTADWVVAASVEFGKKQGKTVIVVNDGPGFYTSRILGPYMNEAGHILSEGVAIEKIDNAIKDFGFPIGPITLLDEVGIDVGTKIAPILEQAFGDRMTPPAAFSKLTEAGRKGRKNKKGFYQYTDGHKGKRPVDETVYADLGVTSGTKMSAEEIAERCALQMINESARCLEEGILNNARDGDIGAIFGLGFPPFLGGPFHYCDTQGLDKVVERLRFYEEKFGDRFTPANILVSKLENNEKFFE